MKAKSLWIRTKRKDLTNVAFIFFSIATMLSFLILSAHAGSDRDLKFSASFDKNEYKKDEPIAVEFKLENKGKKAIYVNKRFYLTSEENQKNGEVYLSIVSPSGEKLPCKASYETGLPKSDYFVSLNPGEGVNSERKFSINYYFDFKAPGTYKIAAVYQNKYGQEIGLDTFKDKIESAPVTIKIVE
jgi:hypothetical protein